MAHVPLISGDIFAWIAEFGLVKPKAGGGGAKLPGSSEPQPTPVRLLAGLLSGEAFIELLNAIFLKHSIRRKLSSHLGDRQQSWAQVAKGLHHFNVELDDETVQVLSSGDATTVLELLGEVHYVYRQWAIAQTKRIRRNQAQSRSQPQQGPQPQQGRGYAAAAAARTPLPSPSASEATAVIPAAALEATKSRLSPRRSEGDHGITSDSAADPLAAESAAASEDEVAADASGGLDEMPAMLPREGLAFAFSAPPKEKHILDPDEILAELSADLELEAAQSAPELIGLAMVQGLKISPAQVRDLLVDGARRLARAFGDSRERQRSHFLRWLATLSHYRGVLAELLHRRPTDAAWLLTALGHGLAASSLEVAEGVCSLLAGICSCLAGSNLRSVCANWLMESAALRDLTILVTKGGAVAASSAAGLLMSCCRYSLLPLLSHHLKQLSRGEHDYLSAVHHYLGAFLKQPDVAQACVEQGVVTHFLARCVQRLGDERSTAGTQQAAALMATDLWLVASSRPDMEAFTQEALADLLAALKTATRSHQGLTPQLVAFSCLSRMLTSLCERMDPESTPSVYRTFVYALVETENRAAQDFAMRNLAAFLRQYEGVPVGILVELMLKKFQAAAGEAPSLVELELFLVIVRHLRCTVRHAKLLAQALARSSVEDIDAGRAATIPLLAIMARFGDDESLRTFLGRFVQVCLTKLIQRGLPKVQVTHIHEVLSKLCCLPGGSCEFVIRDLVLQVCKAYLSNFEALHPNLQALVELWPEEDGELKHWAASCFRGDFDEPFLSERGGTSDAPLELRSLTPSVAGGGGDVMDHEIGDARALAGGEFSEGRGAAGDEVADHEFDSPHERRVRALAVETQALRDELHKAREDHNKALEEAQRLRSEVDGAREVQKKVQDEVLQLKQRREDILARKVAVGESGAGRGPGRQRSDGKQKRPRPPTQEELDRASALLKAFGDAIGAIFAAYAKAKRSQAGRQQVLSLDLFEQILADFEITPVRLPKNLVQQIVRAAKLRPKPGDDTLVLNSDDFRTLLPPVCDKAFRHEEATPFSDFGLIVPVGALDDVGAPCLQTQAMLQHLLQVSATSKVSAVRTVRPALARALRLYVLGYAQETLHALNARLDEGTSLQDLPKGFEVITQEPQPVYSVPAFLPICASERHCAELLDEILAAAVGTHFLESTVSEEAKPRAVVHGYPDLAVLAPPVLQSRESQPKRRSAPPGPPVFVPLPGSDAAAEASRAPAPPRAALDGAPGRRAAPPGPSAFAPLPVSRTTNGSDAVAEAGRAPAPPRALDGVPGLRRGGIAASAPALDSQAAPGGQRRPRSQQPPTRQQEQGEPLNQKQLAQRGQGRAPAQLRSKSEERQTPREAAPALAPRRAPVAALTPSAPPGPPPAQPGPRARPKVSAKSGVGAAGGGTAAAVTVAESGNDTLRVAAAALSATDSSQAPEGPKEPPKAREKVSRKQSLKTQDAKSKQEVLQAAWVAPAMQKLAQSAEPGLKKIFEFFAGWMRNTESMSVAAFIKFGECFGLLNKEALGQVFKQFAGPEVRFDAFPRLIFVCVVRVVEAARGGNASDEDVQFWTSGFRAFCRHMLLQDAKAMKKALDVYRRDGAPQPAFVLGDGIVAGRAIASRSASNENMLAVAGPDGDEASGDQTAADHRQPGESHSATNREAKIVLTAAVSLLDGEAPLADEGAAAAAATLALAVSADVASSVAAPLSAQVAAAASAGVSAEAASGAPAASEPAAVAPDHGSRAASDAPAASETAAVAPDHGSRDAGEEVLAAGGSVLEVENPTVEAVAEVVDAVPVDVVLGSAPSGEVQGDSAGAAREVDPSESGPLP